MLHQEKLRFLFAINPVSGGKDKSDWETGIRDYFREQPHDIEILLLTGDNDEEALQNRIQEWQPNRVVAVGGDGTIKMVAEQVLDKPITLGILPAGSANGMARELNIPLTVAESLDVLVSGEEKPIDIICINDKEMCLHLSDIGLNAQLIKYYNDNNLRGKLGYARGVLRVLLRRRLMRVQIQTHNEEVQRAALMVAIANAKMYGTGAVINPDGDVSDGQFEVVVMRRLAFWTILKMFYRFQPFDPAHIEIYSATSLQITTKRKAYFQIDGEYRGKVKEIKAEIVPGKLRVMLPA